MQQDRLAFNLSIILFTIILSVSGNWILAAGLTPGLHADVEYCRAAGESLRLDAYVPAGEGPHPVAILVHGGGWIGGDKQDMNLFYDSLSQAGFTWFSINYRLAPAHRWPACLDDVRTAIRWVKDHAPDYQGDPERIALLGYSAGGHLACMAAIQEPVQAVVGCAPPIDHLSDSIRRGGLSECMQQLLNRPTAIDKQNRELLQSISPINQISSNLPPFLLVHGAADQSVSYSQSTRLREKLLKHNVPCQLITIEGAPHRITEWVKYDPDYQQQIITWLVKTLGNKTATAQITVSPDGSGDFTTVRAAIDSIPSNNACRTVIHIKPGTYQEIIIVPRMKRYITFQGQNAETTILTNHLYASMKDDQGKELGTFRTPTVTIEADDFSAEKITFENTLLDKLK